MGGREGPSQCVPVKNEPIALWRIVWGRRHGQGVKLKKPPRFQEESPTGGLRAAPHTGHDRRFICCELGVIVGLHSGAGEVPGWVPCERKTPNYSRNLDLCAHRRRAKAQSSLRKGCQKWQSVTVRASPASFLLGIVRPPISYFALKPQSAGISTSPSLNRAVDPLIRAGMEREISDFGGAFRRGSRQTLGGGPRRRAEGS
jgi:hypothetical protein